MQPSNLWWEANSPLTEHHTDALVMAAAASTKRSKETYLGVEGQEVFVAPGYGGIERQTVKKINLPTPWIHLNMANFMFWNS